MKISPIHSPNYSIPARAAEGETQSENDDTITLSWNDKASAKAIHGAGGAIVGGIAGTVPILGQTVSGLALAGGVGYAGFKAGSAVGKKLASLAFSSDQYRSNYEGPLSMATGVLLAATLGAATAYFALPATTANVTATFAHMPSVLAGAAAGAIIGSGIPVIE